MQLLPGLYANVAQESARHLAEERLDEIQPGSVFGRQNIMEPIGTGRQVGLGLLGEVRRMVIQDQTQDPIRRVESIQVLEQSDEFAAAMPPLDPGGYVTGVQIQGRQDGAGPETFLFVVAAPAGMPTRYWFQIGRGVSDGLDAGFFIHRDGDDRNDPALLILQRNFLIHQQNLAHLGFQIGVAPFQVIRDLFRMQRSFGQDSVNRGFGRARQRTISRLAGMLAHMPGQRASAPDFRGIPQLLRLATGQMNHPRPWHLR